MFSRAYSWGFGNCKTRKAASAETTSCDFSPLCLAKIGACCALQKYGHDYVGTLCGCCSSNHTHHNHVKLSKLKTFSFKLTKYECSVHRTCIQNRSHFHAKVHIYVMPLKGVFSSLGIWDAGKLCADPTQCALCTMCRAQCADHNVPTKMCTAQFVLHKVSKM